MSVADGGTRGSETRSFLGSEFEGGPEKPRPGLEYDVTLDGKRFLLDSVVEGSTSEGPLTAVVNWSAGLKR